MSFNFAIKDLYHYKEQTRSYLKSTTAVIALMFFFSNIIPSFGLLNLPASINLYTITIIEIFTQYNKFLLILALILTGFVVISNNHALIQTRKSDIAVMKSVGTYPRQLYSFYISELLIILTFSLIAGALIGFVSFIVVFLIANSQFIGSQLNIDSIYAVILAVGLILGTYIVNGYEIRQIGLKSYNETKTGHINETMDARLSSKWKNWLKGKSINLTLAIKNLMRKKYLVKEYLIMISVAGMILFTGIIGVLTVSNSGTTFIDQAQGKNVIAIGANPVLTSYSQGYESFTNNNTQNFSQNYLSKDYNLSSYTSDLEVLLSKYNIEHWESRLFTFQEVYEKSGIVQTFNDDGTLGNFSLIEGQKRSSSIPIQGVDFNSKIQDWYSNGESINSVPNLVIGDTLAAEMFENARYQEIVILNDETGFQNRFKIDAIVVDPFNNGNSAYLNRDSLQARFNCSNYNNLLIIDFEEIAKNEVLYNNFIAELETSIQNSLGDDFSFEDLSEQFKRNIRSIHTAESVTVVISILMGLFIIFILYHYQKGRIQEDQKDLIIQKALGAVKRDLRNSSYFEQVAMISMGLLLALIGTMILIMFFLMQDVILPSLLLPLSIFGGTLILLLFLTFFTTHILVEKYHKQLACWRL